MIAPGGWTCAYRKIWEHPLFAGNALRVGVFQWLVHTAAWKPTRFKAGREVITLERGQLCISQRQVETETGMSRQQFRTFIRDLEAEGAVQTRPVTKSTQSRTLITICNYEKYQDRAEAVNPASTQHQPTKEQGNNTSEPYGSDNVPSADEIKRRLWSFGVASLAADGVKNPRPIIGKWAKEYGEAATMSALLTSEGKAERVSFITACLKRGQRDEPTTDFLTRRGYPDLEERARNSGGGGDHRASPPRHAADDVPGMQSHAAEERRPVPFRDVQAGRDCLALLALQP